MTRICIISTGHSLIDDRIYYKEALSIVRRYPSVSIIANDMGQYSKKNDDITFVPLRKPKSIMQRLLINLVIIKRILMIKPQVCHFHDFEFIFALPFLKIFSRCKIIYDVHEAYPEMAEASNKIPKLFRPVAGKLVALSEKLLSYFADWIITADDNIASAFKHKHNVVTIFNYPRLSIFSPEWERVSYLKCRYADKVPIIYQGGISENRGLFTMIGAMEILKGERPDIILLLVGEMEDGLLKRAKQEIHKKKLQENIDIIGWVSHKDVVNYIYISKVGLVPFLQTKKFMKNIPIKQFEYMACGVPVLGSDLPPIASYIEKAQCGRLFDSSSADALALGVLEIIRNEEEWKRMSEAGRKAVTDIWNWDKMEDKLMTVYDNLLSAS